jgi:hypothetical protein
MVEGDLRKAISMDIKRLMEPLFEQMGRALDEARADNEQLAVVYFQIVLYDGTKRSEEFTVS